MNNNNQFNSPQQFYKQENYDNAGQWANNYSFPQKNNSTINLIYLIY